MIKEAYIERKYRCMGRSW